LFTLAAREERGREDRERACGVAVELARATRMDQRGLVLAEREMGTGDLHVRGRRAGRDADRLGERLARRAPSLEATLRDADGKVRVPHLVAGREDARVAIVSRSGSGAL